MLQIKPKKVVVPPTNPVRLRLFKLANDRTFEIFIMVAIGLSVLFMAVATYPPTSAIDTINFVMEIVFTVIFATEAAIKLAAYSPRGYFSEAWNVFDFCLVVVAIVDLATVGTELLDGINPAVLRTLRMFRIARLLRLVRSAKGLRTSLYTVILSLPGLSNVFSLFLLLLVIYAIIVMSVFGHVIEQPYLGYAGYATFDNFGGTLLLLIQSATTEGWNLILEACSVQAPFCGPEAGALLEARARLFPLYPSSSTADAWHPT
eukprot:5598239-Pleurochrysis_carterae.AAC.2